MEKRKRKERLAGSTYQQKTGCGTLYVTINEDEAGLFELFGTMGKAGGCAAAQIETIGRTISLGLRMGIPVEQYIRQLQGISCHSAVNVGENQILSCADAIAKTLKMHLANKEVLPAEGSV